jgi:ectoine hydroxylase-related dioxygenase (phytanoyl-CoA dioxygenase family)
VTLALDTVTVDSGAIVCLRGSHVLPVLPHRPSGVLGASLGLVEPPDTTRFPEVVLRLDPGDAALHHTLVIHRTGPNRTAGRRRQLGFAYHAEHARRDESAAERYREHLARVHAGLAAG